MIKINKITLFMAALSLTSINTFTLRQSKEISPLSSTTFSFSQWKEQCDKLPLCDPKNTKTPLTPESIKTNLNFFYKAMQQEFRDSQWLKDKKLSKNFFLNNQPSSKCEIEAFEPFVQKVVIPAKSKVAVHGDLHGDVHSLNHFIQQLIEKKYINDNLEITDPNFYMIFLGDYTDRGTNGLEVLSTIVNLKTSNPKKVFLARGNHEDYTLTDRYGFRQEIETKFPHNNPEIIRKRLSYMYNLLPVALYLGTYNKNNGTTNYIQCCHGGIESRVNPISLLQSNSDYAHVESTLRSAETIQPFFNLLKSKLHTLLTCVNGFMWSDFAVNPNKKTTYTRGAECALKVNKNDTHAYLKNISNSYHKVRGFFRAHQHGDPEMDNLILSTPEKGVGKLWESQNKNNGLLWDGIVCTFSVAPAAYRQRGYTKDYFGILTTAEKFEEWHLEMFDGYEP